MEKPDPALRMDEILSTLVEFGVDFVVIGGVAVQAHGYLRGTGGLDIVPDPSLINLNEALAAIDAQPWSGKSPARLDTRFGCLDLRPLARTAGAPASFADLRSRALEVDLDGVLVPVAGLDDLVRMKRAAGRPQDLTDIASLTRSDEELQSEAGEST